MEQETIIVNSNNKKKCKSGHMSCSSGAVYGMGLIGALVYFMQNADTFKMVVIGILKAIAWPALLIYKLLEFLKF